MAQIGRQRRAHRVLRRVPGVEARREVVGHRHLRVDLRRAQPRRVNPAPVVKHARRRVNVHQVAVQAVAVVLADRCQITDVDQPVAVAIYQSRPHWIRGAGHALPKQNRQRRQVGDPHAAVVVVIARVALSPVQAGGAGRLIHKRQFHLVARPGRRAGNHPHARERHCLEVHHGQHAAPVLRHRPVERHLGDAYRDLVRAIRQRKRDQLRAAPEEVADLHALGRVFRGIVFHVQVSRGKIDRLHRAHRHHRLAPALSHTERRGEDTDTRFCFHCKQPAHCPSRDWLQSHVGRRAGSNAAGESKHHCQ